MTASISTSNTRIIALIGVFATLYIVMAGVAGATISPFAAGFPENLIRGFLMTGLIVRTRKMWSATMMGLASGLVFGLAVPSPAPYLLPSTFVSGLVFDLALLGGNYFKNTISLSRVLFAAGISGVAEAATALGILIYIGRFDKLSFLGILANNTTPIGIALGIAISLNLILSLIGAYLAFKALSKRVPISPPVVSQGA